MSVQYIICIVIILSLTSRVKAQTANEDCFLRPSELGPDWYKVPRPVQEGLNDNGVSYMHMPCAATTVFDIAICGCTNLMSYLYESMRKGKRQTVQTKKGVIKKQDAVKQNVEWEGSKPDKPNTGSLLINIRTGEIKNCPFRASPRGRKWYLIRQPDDRWIPMVCAEGTMYDTIKCTCVHITTANRELSPEDEEVLVLEQDITDINKEGTISQSLGIKVSDVDFVSSGKRRDVPFWRRTEQNDVKSNELLSRFKGKSDVRVTLDESLRKPDSSENKAIFDPASKDVISDEHSNLLIRLRPVIPSKSKISPMNIDRRPIITSDTSPTPRSGDRNKMLDQNIPIADQHDSRVDILHVIDEIKTQIIRLENVGSDDIIYQDNTTVGIVTPVDGRSNEKLGQIKDDADLDIYDEIFYQEECSKKPLPELGPQYFLYYVMDIGFVPYTCHGNAIYDDSICACMPSPEMTAFDEVRFPEQGCSKRPIPEMGPQYFEDYVIDVGYVPFACSGDRIFAITACACM